MRTNKDRSLLWVVAIILGICVLAASCGVSASNPCANPKAKWTKVKIRWGNDQNQWRFKYACVDSTIPVGSEIPNHPDYYVSE